MFGEQLVDKVAQLCKSGDSRKTIETLDDHTIKTISDRFLFLEEAISDNLLDGAPIFQNRFPSCYGVGREPHNALDQAEVKSVLKKIITSMRRNRR